jgi:hypothetical protein
MKWDRLFTYNALILVPTETAIDSAVAPERARDASVVLAVILVAFTACKEEDLFVYF